MRTRTKLLTATAAGALLGALWLATHHRAPPPPPPPRPIAAARRAALARVRAVASGRAGIDPRAAAEVLDAPTVALAVEELLRDVAAGRADPRSARRLPAALAREDRRELIARAAGAIARARARPEAATPALARVAAAAHAARMPAVWRVVMASEAWSFGHRRRRSGRLAPHPGRH